MILGGEGDDTLTGGNGNDSLNGGAGNDTYVFAENFGYDTIAALQGNDTFIFQWDFDLLNDAQYQRDGDNLLISINGSSLSITNAFADPINFTLTNLVTNQVVHSSGLLGDRVIVGTDGDDELRGYFGNDTLYGLEGNDYLQGRNGNDTLDGGIGEDLLEGGHGNDQIYAGDDDDIIYGGTGADVIWGGNGNDILVGYYEGYYTDENLESVGYGNDEAFGDSDEIHGGADDDALYSWLRELSPEDQWSALEWVTGLVARHLYGDEGNDTLYGMPTDYLYGGAGDDTLSAAAYEDWYMHFYLLHSDSQWATEEIAAIESGAYLDGGVGNDHLAGSVGNDTLDGGSGDDELDGGAGADTLIFNEGDGEDVIIHSDASDVIQINADPNNVYVVRDINDWLIKYKNSNDSIRIVGTIGVNTIQFTDGSNQMWELDDTVLPVDDTGYTIAVNVSASSGTQDAFFLDPAVLLENDVLGEEGSWAIVDGDGDGFVDGAQARFYNANNEDITDDVNNNSPYGFGFYIGEFFGGNTIILFPQAAGGRAEITYFIQKEGAGPVYAAKLLVSFDGDAVLNGSDTDDYLDGMDATVLTMDGGLGNDTIYGSSGIDTVLHRSGDGNDLLHMGHLGADAGMDTLVLFGNGSTTASNVRFGQDGLNLLIHLHGETITVDGYFHESSGWLYNYNGTVGSIQLFQNQAAYNAWKADPVNNSGNLIQEWTPDGVNGTIAIRSSERDMRGTDGHDVITSYTASGLSSSAIHNTVDGGAGHDTITTLDGADVLIGGTGNDTLRGGDGSDTYQFAAGDGQDVIHNYDELANTGIDLYGNVLQDEDVLTITGITDYRDIWLHQSGDDLIVDILGSSDQVTVKDWFVDNDSIGKDETELDAIRISNGTTTWELNNDQASISTLNDNFDRLLQAMATFETNNSGVPASAPTTLDDGNSGNAYTSWVVVTA